MLRNLVFALLWCLVLIMPWEEMAAFSESATLTRTFGLLALAASLPALSGSQLRPLPLGFLSFTLFVIWSIFSVFWSVDRVQTLERGITNVMLLGFVWMIWEFAPSPPRQRLLLLAFFFGCMGPLASEYLGFRSRESVISAMEQERFSAANVNENSMAASLVISIAIAIYFASNPATKLYRFRLVFWAYVLGAALGTLLTASRGGVLCLLVLGASTLIMLGRMNWKVILMFLVCTAAIWYIAPAILPKSVQERLSEGKEAHSLMTRFEIWQAGLTGWLERPLQGFGTATYPVVSEAHGGPHLVAHNTYVNVLVEQGVIGLTLFLLAWLLAFRNFRQMPRPEQLLCLTMSLSYLPISLSGSMEYQKPFWFIYIMVLSLCGNPWRSALPRPNPGWTPSQTGRPYLPLGRTP